jgi:hypothetical protein
MLVVSIRLVILLEHNYLRCTMFLWDDQWITSPGSAAFAEAFDMHTWTVIEMQLGSFVGGEERYIKLLQCQYDRGWISNRNTHVTHQMGHGVPRRKLLTAPLPRGLARYAYG